MQAGCLNSFRVQICFTRIVEGAGISLVGQKTILDCGPRVSEMQTDAEYTYTILFISQSGGCSSHIFPQGGGRELLALSVHVRK